jgi:hypothetical protein
VRFFREGGDVKTLKWLAGRNDGMVVNPEQEGCALARDRATVCPCPEEANPPY